jgi:hypothetical protein
MNRIKTFFIFVGVIMISTLIIRVLTFLSNKIFDNISDILYLPTLGAALGYLPIIIATKQALNVSNNYDKTRKIIWIWKLCLSIIIILLGIDLFFERLLSENSMFKLDEKINFLSYPDHWLFYIPLGIFGLVAAFEIKQDKLDF